MSARNNKQPRSQLEPLTTSEMITLHSLVERARANGQMDDLLMSLQLHGGPMAPDVEASPKSSMADFMVVENANESASSAAGGPKKGITHYKAPPVLPSPPKRQWRIRH